MNQRKLKKVVCITLLISMLFGTTVFAASYTGYVLPARQGNNYTGTHSKQTAKNYITNRVTDIENADTVTFWAADSNKKQISADYDQKLCTKVSDSTTIKFTAYGYSKKGKQVIMGMENADFYWVERAFVAGTVNFN